MASTTEQEDRKAAPKYPGGIPDKFDPDGKAQPFPGNTIVCHLSPSSPLYASLLGLYAKMEASPLSRFYTLLPPASWHMTVFEGVCDKVRRPAYWPADLAIDAPLEECTALFEQRLGAFDLACAPPYRMKITGLDQPFVGIGLHIEPQTDEEGVRLRRLRDRLADALGIRHPVHDEYGLHLSMAYLIRFPSDEESKALEDLFTGHIKDMATDFELGAPEFCTFDDMFAFKRLFYLANQP